jgi:hypothetical protein
MAKLFASLFVMLLAATSVRAAPCGGDFNGFLAAMARDAPGQGVSGDPSYAFALLQDPGRSGRTSPLAVLPTPPPANPSRRHPRAHNIEANTGL